jgi:hypothetical protein
LPKHVQVEPHPEEEPRPKTLLHSRQRTTGVKLEKLGMSEVSLSKTHVNTEDASSSILNLKNIKLSPDEQQFIKEYRRLEELEREKGIKFFQCLGDPPHTEQFVREVENKRRDYITQDLVEMRQNDCTRFSTVIN